VQIPILFAALKKKRGEGINSFLANNNITRRRERRKREIKNNLHLPREGGKVGKDHRMK
jgi:hypothetical protein